MKLKTVLKTIGTFVSKSKTQIVKHGPQIMAVAGAGCFIAGTYCAIKETPKAMAKLEAKKKLDPNMGKLQTVAVVAPEYKKTLACTAAGITFTGLAWHLEAKHVATLTAALSGALKEKDQLIEASKKVVGEEKTGEIMAKKEEIAASEKEAILSGNTPTDLIPYPFAFPNGTVIWMSMRQFKTRWAACVDELLENGVLSEYDYFKHMKPMYVPILQDTGWSKTAHFGHLWDTDAVKYHDWAEETLAYDLCCVEMENTDQPGYEVVWKCDPEKLTA